MISTGKRRFYLQAGTAPLVSLLISSGAGVSSVAAGQTEAFLFNDAISHWVSALRGLDNETEE